MNLLFMIHEIPQYFPHAIERTILQQVSLQTKKSESTSDAMLQGHHVAICNVTIQKSSEMLSKRYFDRLQD
jgi:hypothetical protein